MTTSLRSIFMALALIAALPLAACGSDVEGTGGGGNGTGGSGTTTSTGSGTTTTATTSTGGSKTCDDYCAAQFACVTTDQCVLVDAAGAKALCVTSCEAGLATLTAMERSVLQTCLDCVFAAAAPGTCFEDLSFQSCEAACNTPAVEAAGEKWSDAATPPSGSSAGLCTNGQDILSPGECSAGSDGNTCSLECCNGTCGATPTVAVTCSPYFGAATCTCTAGKNKGKTFQSMYACDVDLWNQCNL